MSEVKRMGFVVVFRLPNDEWSISEKSMRGKEEFSIEGFIGLKPRDFEGINEYRRIVEECWQDWVNNSDARVVEFKLTCETGEVS